MHFHNLKLTHTNGTDTVDRWTWKYGEFMIRKQINLRRQIFEGKLSVSSHFLHRYQDKNIAGMLLVGELSLETLDVYHFIIF